ncbi:hypothetical protein [Microbulbifer sp. DLAB2-AA]|uniref:hypothetical protein n=1 Tax=Microbulbifer sp. DLAB2-AA TaxID=3243394 RepID=UPI00403940F5
MPKENIYTDRVVGNLSRELFKQKKRLDALEESSTTPQSKWEHHFNQKPWLVLSSFSAALCLGFWAIFNWQGNRHEKELANVKADYEKQITWLKEKNTQNIASNKKNCDYDLKVLSDKHKICESKLASIDRTEKESIISKGTGRDKAAPLL